MKYRRKIRVMAWILTVVMLMTSLGLDALPVMAADAGSFTYEVSFDASFTTAGMTFTLQTIGGEAPTETYNVDIFIKPSGVDEYQQIGWYQGGGQPACFFGYKVPVSASDTGDNL